MAMQNHTDTLPLAPRRADTRRSRRPADKHRRDIGELDKSEIRRDAFVPYNYAGTMVVASAWLAIYVIAALYSLVASSPALVHWLR